MLKKFFRAILRKKIISIFIILAIIGASYFGYKRIRGSSNETRYVLAAVEKGTLIVSVSGSGQVVVLDQADIKSLVFGELKAIYVRDNQEVKSGQLLFELDKKDIQQEVKDAEVALNSAKAKLAELLSQPDAKSLVPAENAVAQAERDLNKAKENYEEITIDAERSLATAYEDGYSTVSTTFFKLSSHMEDLKNVLGTEEYAQKNISAYRLILGSESPFIKRLLDDYSVADNLFTENFVFFRQVYRDADRDTIYQLINNTLETTKAVSQALESARHMFDAISVESYGYLTMAPQIDALQPKIESDVSSVYSDINSLEKIKDTIDDTVKNTPQKIKDAELAIKSAQEKLDEKNLDLEELKTGADPQDIESQKNVVAQKENAFSDAQEKLAECLIRAPFDGTIVNINSEIKNGNSVSAGTVLASVVTQQKIAEISLNEVDAAKVKVGQKVTLTFDALADVSITGKVIDVDLSGTVTQGVVSYGVKIAFDTQEEKVKPGMSVTADIITDVKQDVLLLPNNAVKNQGTSYAVELVDASGQSTQALLASASGTILSDKPKSQTVEVGISNDTSTEIVNGLKEGDVVVVSTVNSSSSSTNNSSTQNRSNQGFQIPGVGSERNFQMRGL
ncbi:MAG: hypothetical protein COX36_04510 [Candidatus Nealsonbacteria bacterium CG23_combo_of_CG06-09_8_20_14_all_38_19]|uniref:Uncharacterized protein n=1 Tax=Candidatus Nealsonbacteria bacterium CG23_combo_of_CG06-09_8_20_14_all_38_19 TaxID=1974721 RepID=A0A2G9YWV8_9BACT|nr:MAG: hypothetical protein COX36_04510 [Candidatus Nealsonbacteria bacterium CG23_combo_of_CG06-09_8_20_14_all_38_19]